MGFVVLPTPRKDSLNVIANPRRGRSNPLTISRLFRRSDDLLAMTDVQLFFSLEPLNPRILESFYFISCPTTLHSPFLFFRKTSRFFSPLMFSPLRESSTRALSFPSGMENLLRVNCRFLTSPPVAEPDDFKLEISRRSELIRESR